MSRTATTALCLLRGWIRVQTGHPPERPEHNSELRLTVAGQSLNLVIRDTESDIICLLDILVRGAYDTAIALGCQHGVGVAYDIGANIGVATTLLRLRLGCHIVAFEPGFSELACLEKNADTTVLVLPVAVTGSELALHEFRVSSTASGGQHLAACPTEAEGRFVFSSHPVLGASIEVWRQHLRLPAPDLIKIDAEGSESTIIPNLLSAGLRPRIIVVETHGENNAAIVRRTMASAGYDLVDQEHGRRATAILTYTHRHSGKCGYSSHPDA